jgi:integral membrane sensor domain MASE1
MVCVKTLILLHTGTSQIAHLINIYDFPLEYVTFMTFLWNTFRFGDTKNINLQVIKNTVLSTYEYEKRTMWRTDLITQRNIYSLSSCDKVSESDKLGHRAFFYSSDSRDEK